MSSFLRTDALNHIEKHFDHFPLIKLDCTLDWVTIEQYLTMRRTRYLRDNGDRSIFLTADSPKRAQSRERRSSRYRCCHHHPNHRL